MEICGRSSATAGHFTDYRCVSTTLKWGLSVLSSRQQKGLSRVSNHHLMKTFCTGIGGWADQQYPDGTVVWTSPSGQHYTTQPGSRLFYPDCDVTTTALPPPTSDPPLSAGDRGLKMPRRQRTRAADQTARIKTERTLNHAEHPPF